MTCDEIQLQEIAYAIDRSACTLCLALDLDRGVGQFGFLDDAVIDARIVQLGENTHGVKDDTALKTGAIRYLHAQMGFDVIAFESAVYQCDESDLHLAQMAEPDRDQIVARMTLRSIAAYIRQQSADANTDQRAVRCANAAYPDIARSVRRRRSD